jgi:hypothetical protein
VRWAIVELISAASSIGVGCVEKSHDPIVDPTPKRSTEWAWESLRIRSEKPDEEYWRYALDWLSHMYEGLVRATSETSCPAGAVPAAREAKGRRAQAEGAARWSATSEAAGI